MQRAVGNLGPLALQELLDPGELEPPLLPRSWGQPATNRLQVREQFCLHLPGASVPGRPVPEEYFRSKGFGGRIRSWPPPQALRRTHIPADRLPRMAADTTDYRLALAPADTFQNCQNLPHGHLSIGHPRTSRLGSGAKMARVAAGGWVKLVRNSPSRWVMLVRKTASQAGHARGK